MIREDRFLISRKPYAVDLSTVTAESAYRYDAYWLEGECLAVWFRRKNGTTYACLGALALWAHRLRHEPDTSSPEAILRNDLDSRYGGDTHGRWDGERYWGSQKPFEQALHLTVLEPMLANYPELPPGHSGWWRF